LILVLLPCRDESRRTSTNCWHEQQQQHQGRAADIKIKLKQMINAATCET